MEILHDLANFMNKKNIQQAQQQAVSDQANK
jgi:hypothetical protein